MARLADALSGSASLFEASGRSRLASLNFITAHDGFTLADLVSYDRKHNEANGEQNRDGHGDNRSYNHGFEGRTEDEDILARRAQTSRNLMASLMISQGVPMITAGDEIGRTQQGNNNAYCQDNPITWIDWTSTPESHAMLRSTKRVIRLRKEFLAGQPHDYPARDKQSYLHWFDEHGEPMSDGQLEGSARTGWSSSCSAPTTARWTDSWWSTAAPRTSRSPCRCSPTTTAPASGSSNCA